MTFRITRRWLLAATAALPFVPVLSLAQTSADQEEVLMQIRVTFGPEDFTVTLFDNASSRELAGLLPLGLTIEDFGGNEKIARMSRKLENLVRGPVPDPAPGDLCIYVPWGNLAFFHGGYQSTRDLVRLGRLDGPVTPLLTKGEFSVHITAI
jgi:hypothetical protein